MAENSGAAGVRTGFHPDSAVDQPDQDQFGRWPFAQRVANLIAERGDPSSLCIGLYGEWGEGKTSVLNLIRWDLLNSYGDRVVVVPYNPWRFGSEEEILLGFYRSLADALKDQIPAKRKAKAAMEMAEPYVKRLGGLLSLLNEGAGKLVDLGAAALKMKLEEHRETVEAVLRASKRRAVILLDDVDRLEKSEVQALFRLVKLSADFQNTVYVLAMDENIVADSLAERYGNDAHAGRRFLEKVIHLPLPIPAVGREAILGYCNGELARTLNQCGVELRHMEKQEFSEAFREGVLPGLRTPRLVKRYSNALQFSLPLLHGEVHTTDLLLAEGLRAVYPEVFAAIREAPDDFLGDADSVDLGVREIQERHARGQFERLQEVTRSRPQREQRAILHLVRTLFPDFGDPQSMGGSGTDDLLRRERRVAHQTYLRRWLFFSVPPDDVSEHEVDELMNGVMSGSAEQLAGRLKAFKKPAVLLERLGDRCSRQLAPDVAERLALALAHAGDHFPHSDGELFSTADTASYLIRHLACQAPREQHQRIAVGVIDASRTLPLAVRFFSVIRDDREGRGSLPTEAIQLVGARLAPRVRTELERRGTTTLEEERHLSYYMLSIWRDFGDASALLAHLRGAMETDPHQALALVAAVRGGDFYGHSQLGYLARLLPLQDFDLVLQQCCPMTPEEAQALLDNRRRRLEPGNRDRALVAEYMVARQRYQADADAGVVQPTT